MSHIDAKNMTGELLEVTFIRDVRMTLYGRCYDVKTLKRCCENVVLKSCSDWEIYAYLSFIGNQ